MIRRFCDKCGKEIEGPYYNISYTRVDGENQMPVKHLDMCEYCVGTKTKESDDEQQESEDSDK